MEQPRKQEPHRNNGQHSSGGGKRLTKAQRRRRHNIRRYSILGGFGLLCILLLIGMVSLTSHIARALSGNSADTAAQEISAAVHAEVSASPTPSPSPTATPIPESTVSLLAVGDNLIHSTLIEYGEQDDGTYDFTAIYEYLQDEIQSADLACIQQETIYISDPSEYSNYPVFGTPTEMADSLHTVGFDVICHASNHTYDKNQYGVDDTLEKWAQYPDTTVLGIHASQEDADRIQVVEKNGIRLALFDYTYGVNYLAPTEDYVIDFLDEDHKERIRSQLQAASELSDMIVVFMHCGTEDSFSPDSDQLSWAQFFADEGVGLIVGTHPHVVEPLDTIIGKNGNKMPIFYSLGNFVSSQSENINMLGGMANVTIKKDNSGTYVSDFSLSPLMNIITKGGTHGNGYVFRVCHLEDYTDDMASEHIREECLPEDMWSIWEEIMGTRDYPIVGSTDSSAPAAPSASSAPADTGNAA